MTAHRAHRLLTAAVMCFVALSQAWSQEPDPAAARCGFDPDGWAEAALARSTGSHAGLPPVPHPAFNRPTASKIELGRKLFFDRRLSINGTMSCAMCHVPEQGFANRELQTAVGVEGRSTKRNAPTVINSAFLDVLFADGRDISLETQFLGPLVARNEMANPSAGHVLAQIRDIPEYRRLFAAAFDTPPSLDRIGMALAAYQRSLIAADTPFDRWYFLGVEAALSTGQKRGYRIFAGRGECATCHTVSDDSALFTDQQFHDTGYGWMREQLRQRPPAAHSVQVAPGVFYEISGETVASVSAPREADLGRYEVTEKPIDRWKFRTPSLRNVAETPPYMHDGGLLTLRDVVDFYNDGGPRHDHQDERIRPLGLTDRDKDDLEAFLRSLTSPDLACLARESRIARPDNH